MPFDQFPVPPGTAPSGQAKGTPGWAIMEGRTLAKAAIHRLTGYSAHADQQTLCDWVAAMPDPPGDIRLVHGEPAVQKALHLLSGSDHAADTF